MFVCVWGGPVLGAWALELVTLPAAGGEPHIHHPHTKTLKYSRTHTRAQHPPPRFRLAAEADLAPYLPRIKERALAHAVAYG